ncbi:type IV secretory system conjugative DNA transfer family protein [Bradyrhizobium japonicum]|uniref:type IV secretory system conjugative DNA transfer family protein n=1 Tax=Bradyrhizobium japonicum TaxID=375 RepID=UPI0004569090|nr:helicase HerA-like domain-containing protein [Bradyrhizobium japonicum]AHY52457.1 hypothetical protein BJS_05981 [Bradyrhizobium japonicum SEMIA 5079]MCD9110290.1 DUF853 family protein [Bradyrhizobium japonicum]MCD9257469.1 DUF853 family protein [Bradyrhizobium japonicum SEMIA 5079]MCD9895133.1 DUF853 family protein [Bradyrhizobium japonicum]MCD9910739.1 DUF853 family protein [Bradyrhizobium japonicum]
MPAKSADQPMDFPTFMLAGALLCLLIGTAALALTGIGLMSAFATVGFCRFFGRPNLALALGAMAVALLVLSLSLDSPPNIWVIAYRAYWATWTHHTFPVVTFRIWLDPTELFFDRLALGSVGMIVGSAFELVAQSRRNSRMAVLQRTGGVPHVKRAPIALICAGLASWISAGLRRHHSLLGTRFLIGFWYWFSDADANHHTLICGSTGKGKTVTLANLIESSIDRGQGLVLADGKGDVEFAERVRKYAQAKGRPVYVFNTLNIADSCAYSALSCGDFTAKADRIMRLREHTEPHHESLAKSFLQTTFKVLAFENRPIDLVQLSDVLSINALLKIIGRRGFSDPARAALIREINEHAVAQKTSIDGVKSDIRFIANSALGLLFDTEKAKREGRPILDLETARREGAVVLFVLPPLLFQNAAPLIGQLIINDLKAVTTTSRSIWKLFFDEFSVFSTTNVLNLINMGRTFGVCGTLATQSLADFDAGAPQLGGSFGRQVRASVNTVICHQVGDPDDAELLARYLGTYPDIELTAQIQADRFTGDASARAVRQFRIHPDDLKFIPRGRAYVFNRNNGTAELIAVRKSSI